jgi:hypothetical protein
MRGFFSKELYEAFLRNSPPSSRFQIESWSDDWIRSQSLDSDELAKAFELQSEELVPLGHLPLQRTPNLTIKLP